MQSTTAKGKRVLTKAAKQAQFLEFYAECGNIQSAAKKAHINRAQHYNWLLQDPDYEARFASAHQDACDLIEGEIHRRGVEGVLEPVWYQGKKCGSVRRYSDILLIVRAKALMPEKYRDNFKAQIEHKGEISPPARNPALALLTDEELDRVKTILETARARGNNGRSEFYANPQVGLD